MGEGIDTAYAGIDTVGKREVDDPINGAERNSRFGPIPSEGIESFPPAACQHHGQDFLHWPLPFSKESFETPLFALLITEILKNDSTDFPLFPTDFQSV